MPADAGPPARCPERVQVALYALGVLAACMVQVAWWLLAAPPPPALAAGTGALLLAGLWAWRACSRAEVGCLAWDGAAWSWGATGRPSVAGAVSVCLDLQGCMLLRFQAAGSQPCWLWVRDGGDADGWRALRRALFAPTLHPTGTPTRRSSAGVASV